MKKKILIFTIVFVLLGGGLFYQTTFRSLKYKGYKMVSKLVENQLKNPDTLDFPSYFDNQRLTVLKLGDKSYRYDGYCSSKTDIGVPKRIYFEIALTYDGDGKFIIDKMNINQNN